MQYAQDAAMSTLPCSILDTWKWTSMKSIKEAENNTIHESSTLKGDQASIWVQG